VDLLLKALLSSDAQAHEVWAAWRAKVEFDKVPYASQQFFPAFGPPFLEWIDKDPAGPIFKGIVRQFWSQNQLRLSATVELMTLFEAADIQASIAGPVAWALRTPGPAIRPIPYLTFLVPRGQIQTAWNLLLDAGWSPACDLPDDAWWDWRGHVSARQGNLHLNLHWRLISVPPEDARECEAAFLAGIKEIEWNQHTLATTSPEVTLLHILCLERKDDLPWQADVALIHLTAIDWAAFLDLAKRFAPHVIERLRESRSFARLEIPELPDDHPGALRRRLRDIWRVYRAYSYHRKQAVSWSGFAEFLVTAGARKLTQAVPGRPPRK